LYCRTSFSELLTLDAYIFKRTDVTILDIEGSRWMTF
jgi:hypothetical protein